MLGCGPADELNITARGEGAAGNFCTPGCKLGGELDSWVSFTGGGFTLRILDESEVCTEFTPVATNYKVQKVSRKFSLYHRFESTNKIMSIRRWAVRPYYIPGNRLK